MDSSTATETTPLIGTSAANGHGQAKFIERVFSPLNKAKDALVQALPDYQTLKSSVPVPKSSKTPKALKVEPKVWFANERTWISYVNNAILLGTLSLGLFNSSHQSLARIFAYVYAAISIGVLIYGFLLYQHRITLIRKRDAFHFVVYAGPLLISAALFTAVLVNFIIRVVELRRSSDHTSLYTL